MRAFRSIVTVPMCSSMSFLLTSVTQVQGQSAKTLHAGETFVEAPADIHLDSRHPSKTVPTRLLVFFVKDKGVPPTVYLEPHSSSH